jgi:hypothetical protein
MKTFKKSSKTFLPSIEAEENPTKNSNSPKQTLGGDDSRAVAALICFGVLRAPSCGGLYIQTRSRSRGGAL